MIWDLSVGEVLARRTVHERYGGSMQGGIAPSAKSDNVLLFSTPSGRHYGYDFDGWKPDRTFHYTGEGQVGDQVFVRGNAAVRDHVARGLRLRLFEAAGRTTVRYLGEFRVELRDSHYVEEAVDRAGELRKVIVFRLRPMDPDVAVEMPAELERPTIRDIPVEAHLAETFQLEPRREPTLAERREADLVQRYRGWLESSGHTVVRNEIQLPNLGRSLYTDLFDLSTSELVEAKSSASRHHVRHAIGQLSDYARFVKSVSRAVLLPSDPGEDLLDLLHSVGVACIYEEVDGTFVRRDP